MPRIVKISLLPYGVPQAGRFIFLDRLAYFKLRPGGAPDVFFHTSSVRDNLSSKEIALIMKNKKKTANECCYWKDRVSYVI
jgi:hypothetical protein